MAQPKTICLKSILLGTVSTLKKVCKKKHALQLFQTKGWTVLRLCSFQRPNMPFCACPSHGPLCTLTTSLVTAEPWLCTSAQSDISTLCLLTFNNGLTDLVDSRGLWAKEGLIDYRGASLLIGLLVLSRGQTEDIYEPPSFQRDLHAQTEPWLWHKPNNSHWALANFVFNSRASLKHLRPHRYERKEEDKMDNGR